MSVGGSGGADDFLEVPDLGDRKGKSGKRTNTPANKAKNKRDRKKTTKQAASSIEGSELESATKITSQRDQAHVAKAEAKIVKHLQGDVAARDIYAKRMGISTAARMKALEFAEMLPDSEKLSRDMLAQIKAEAVKIKSTRGKAAAEEYLNVNLRGLSKEAAANIRERFTPRADEMVPFSVEEMAVSKERAALFRAQGQEVEAFKEELRAKGHKEDTITAAAQLREQRMALGKKSVLHSLRNSVFGGFSAFGLVQGALASFTDALNKATQATTGYITAAVGGGPATASLYTSPLRAMTAALPGTLMATGAGIGAVAAGIPSKGLLAGPGAIVGGAAGYLTGLGIQFGVEQYLNRLEAFDSSLMQTTENLIGISPALTMQAARHNIERLQMQFDRASEVGPELEALNERRFELEKELYKQGTDMIRNGKDAHMELMDKLDAIIARLGGGSRAASASSGYRMSNQGRGM
jgi:hypothetical protein